MSHSEASNQSNKEYTESEEDGEIGKDENPILSQIHSQHEDMEIEEQHSESDQIDEATEDSLDIKPPQAAVKVERSKDSSSRRERKRDRHAHKHESRRKDRRRERDRESHREGRGNRMSELSRRSIIREQDSRRHRRRDDLRRDAKQPREIRDNREVREVRLVERVRDKDPKEREHDITRSPKMKAWERIQQKWRKDRLMIAETQRQRQHDSKKREEIGRDHLQKEYGGRKDKTQDREKERNLDKSRRERSRSPVPTHNEEEPREAEKESIMHRNISSDKSKSAEENTEEQSDVEVVSEEEEEEELKASEGEISPSEKSASGSNTSNSSDSEESSTESEGEGKQSEDEDEQDKKSGLPSSLIHLLPPLRNMKFNIYKYFIISNILTFFICVVTILDEIVALKRLKMEKEKEGFPITSLREINTLLKAQHPNIVTVREIVVGSNMDKIYIVMDYVEHDLKSLMETMKHPFLVGEVKTLMIQLLRAVTHLHDNWILHRDLKTSNLLLSHKGILKVGDFGLAREYGSPLKPYTPVVVTLWYRAPELLLGIKEYSTAIDLWSVGCIFGELLTMKPLFPGKSDIDELNKIFKDLGTPSDKIWPGYSELPLVKKVTFTEYPYNNLRSRFSHTVTSLGFDLMNRFLTYCPKRRITAEEALKHEYFKETPLPVDPSMFPTWPAKSEQLHRKAHSPKPPSGPVKKSTLYQDDADDEGIVAAGGFHMAGAQKGHSAKGAGFSLKF
ncbi:cyclin-dependent kinase 11B-like [Limulus polyphemus]|uniref:Cyclin-dependent kinase 11B-like n=1 Tax=Limulus polyphemus TaxID=6850 RepID=A0ABM1SAM4_LIMPO|nr:cyclin-dependent kinase 11B-like [Limulus polyphemus]